MIVLRPLSVFRHNNAHVVTLAVSVLPMLFRSKVYLANI